MSRLIGTRDFYVNIISSTAQIEPRKKPALLSIESWLFNRDPYFMVYYNPHITG